MNIIARRATPGPWLDASTPISAAAAIEIVRLGYKGVVRTGPLPNNQTGADLHRPELEGILAAGLECTIYQHVRGFPPRAPLWRPADHDGTEDASCIVTWARGVGLPDGVHLYQDLEAVDGTAGEAEAYSFAWARRCVAMAMRAACYCGYAVPLTASELYALPHTSYGSDMGNRQVAVRGTAWLQGPEATVAGVRVDTGTMRADLLGELPYVAAGELLEVA